MTLYRACRRFDAQGVAEFFVCVMPKTVHMQVTSSLEVKQKRAMRTAV